MVKKNTSLKKLLSLLDDPDDDVAIPVMAELLSRENGIDADILAEFQENSSPYMRRRIHQLQSALVQRSRRRNFLKRINDPEVDFFELLPDIHLQWFDNDSLPEVRAKLDAFLDCARRNSFQSLENISGFMLGSGILAEPDTTLAPELYCIGAILRDSAGAASLLSAMMLHLLPADAGARVGKVLNDFGIQDSSGNILLPARNWQVFSGSENQVFTPWDPRDIIKLASANLFSAAVNSDSLRYILTIAQSLSGLRENEVLQVLPYPYNGLTGEEEPETNVR